MSIFREQAEFMVASGQSVGIPNGDQAALYADLVTEEVTETIDAWNAAVMAINCESFDPVAAITEVVDGLIDTIYVCSGMLNSLGVDPEASWAEVHRSNMSKICPETGAVIRRADGKILKPAGYSPPNLEKIVRDSWGFEEQTA